MTQYFKDCNTIDEAKTTFRKLCLILHPDKGGKASDFIELMKQFKSFRPSQKRENENENFDREEFYNIIQMFSGLDGLNISFVGSFIWLEGNTMTHKDAIKSIKIEGYKNANWAKVKKAWFFSPLDYMQKSRSQKNLEEIKQTYGCKTFTPETFYKIAN